MVMIMRLVSLLRQLCHDHDRQARVPGDGRSVIMGKWPVGWRTTSESSARGGLYVVMGPATTQERRDGTHHDKRSQGCTSRQAHLTQKSQWLRPAGWEEPGDHGGTAGGGM